MTPEEWLDKSDATKAKLRSAKGRLPRGWWLGQTYIDCVREWVEPIDNATTTTARKAIEDSSFDGRHQRYRRGLA